MNRYAVIISSGVSLVLCTFGFFFLYTAWADYRYVDFATASDKQDFSSLRTCVSEISDDQLKRDGYDSQARDGKECNTGGDASAEGSLLSRYQNSLAASVHGLYYTSLNPSATTPHWVGRVAGSVATAAVGKMLSSNAYTDGMLSNLYRPSLNETYAALSAIADVPQYCEQIYDGAVEVDVGTEAGKFDDEKIEKPQMRCYFKEGETEDQYDAVSDAMWSQDPIANLSDVKDLLYTLCLRQFSYGRAGPTSGTFYVPLVHRDAHDAGVSVAFYGPIAGWNQSVASFDAEWPWNARINQGIRFGFSVWAYSPFFAALAFFAIDSLMLFVTEISREAVIISQIGSSNAGTASQIGDILTMRATTKIQRRWSLIYGILSFAVSLIFWILFLGVPFGVGTRLPRPICDVGKHEYLWNNYPFNGQTNGGWRLDWDCTFYELLVLLIMLFILILEQFARQLYFFRGTKQAREVRSEQIDLFEGYVTGQQCSSNLAIWSVLGLAGGVVLIAGQALVGARFGYTWAVAIASQDGDGRGFTVGKFNPVTLQDTIYAQTVATFAVCACVGLFFGATVARWLVNGTTCESFILFVLWTIVAIGSFLPLIFGVYTVNTWYDTENQLDQCKIFEPEEDYPIVKEICSIRTWCFIVGISVLLLALVAQFIIGLSVHGRGVCLPRKKVETFIPRDVLLKTRANRVVFPGAGAASGAGYRSKDEPFFNWQSGGEKDEAKESLLPKTAATAAPEHSVQPARMFRLAL